MIFILRFIRPATMNCRCRRVHSSIHKPKFMRPELTLLLLLAFGAFASSAYLPVKSEKEKMDCEKKCSNKKSQAVEHNGGGKEMLDASFNHMSVSTFK